MKLKNCPYCGGPIADDVLSYCDHCGQFGRMSSMYILQQEFPFNIGPALLYQDYVVLKEQEIPYESITRLRYKSQAYSVGPNYIYQVSLGTAANIEVHINNRQIMKFTTSGGAFRRSYSIVDLKRLYELLSDRTYDQRLKSYYDFISDNDYFMYDGVKITVYGELITRNNKKIDLQQYTFEYYGDFIQIVPRNPTLMQKFSKEIKAFHPNATFWKKIIHGDRTIDITRDKDVFVALMFQLYEIKFPSWRP